ncbi:hypothetical protein FNF27_06696 [Cafeteria roenbergensis]|uniref:Uncharacterized protein n=1 Tax=Cafeteria roenbergensis TaxID=33653 RepID=A0A5A8DXM2_CAFRO|nr:hypothetical protein FNF29_07393 [Cafeteria roenbergensis]KAA0163359.1 hypothetical protein FNF28_04280 [Cafeteria roenbergensis]KAA0170262.1 hypothetical protein FNF27_06696 [Cafeteria roenbergensis]|eukprot:KAA0147447.1 hypothetical protein FNF29_07393 [Cafeteria roenbergensis]
MAALLVGAVPIAKSPARVGGLGAARFAERARKADAELAKQLVEKPAWWLPPPPEWGPGQGRAAEPLSHDGKGKYKKLPPPLEKPEWWIPTPAEWGAPQEHASGSFYGPAQIPSPAVGGFGAPQQSDSPPILLASLWQHQYSSGAALLQKSARKHAG